MNRAWPYAARSEAIAASRPPIACAAPLAFVKVESVVPHGTSGEQPEVTVRVRRWC